MSIGIRSALSMNVGKNWDVKLKISFDRTARKIDKSDATLRVLSGLGYTVIFFFL